MQDILVVSDTHGRASLLVDLIYRHPDCETVLFLGDGLSDLETARFAFPDRRFLAVRGNCDGVLHSRLLLDAPPIRTLTVEGVTLMMTHGHLYGVKSGTQHLADYAAENGCNVALFGHTHTPCDRYTDAAGRRILLCNPGSLGCYTDGRRTYGVLHIDNNSALFGIGEP